MGKFPKYCCQKCGLEIGYLGRAMEFIYRKIFRLKKFGHKCTPPLDYRVWAFTTPITFRRYDWPRANFTWVINDWFPIEEEKIGLIKKNKIKHKFLKDG